MGRVLAGHIRGGISALALSFGCAEIRSDFQCQNDAACVRDGIAGVCELTGHCAFPDASCLVTRRRYGLHAGELSETCVVTGRYQWVAPEGDDNAAGTEADPWRTLAFGVTKLAPGDALLLKPGIYEEALVDDIPAGESWKLPVTLAAVPPRGATLRHATPTIAINAPHQRYIVIEGLVIDGGAIGDSSAVVVRQDHIELRDCVVTGSPYAAILLGDDGPDDGWNVIRGVEMHGNATTFVGTPNCGTCDATGTPCDCDDATRICLNAACAPNTMCPSCGDAGGVDISSDHNLIEGCTIRDNEGAGISLVFDGSSNVVRRNLMTSLGARGNAGILVYETHAPLIYDNVIHELPGAPPEGIVVWSAGTDARIFANTLVGAILNVRVGVVRATVQNNIADAFFVNGAELEVACSAAPVDFPEGTIGPNCTNEFPHFVDPLAADFHLVASSPARDSGVPLPEVTIDFDGKKRPAGPAFDIGALEYPE